MLFLLLDRSARPWRAFGWFAVVVTGVMMAAGAKSYYLAPVFPLLFAAGGRAWERWAVHRWARWALAGLVIAGGIPALPLVKGILPVETLAAYRRATGITPASGERHALGRLPQLFADQHGWRELAVAVARVRDTLPASERDRACIFGQNYGQAGAIDYFGRDFGLPRAVSGHNSYWLWGPRDCGRETWIVIGDDRASLEAIFESVELGATFECGLCMPYEDGKPIWIARRMKREPAVLWPSTRHFI